jgi:hypothetical protein
MEEKPYKYDAFISYRHVEPDMTIAARLHTMLETFTLPKNLRAESNNQRFRVFRDREELSAADLSDSIQEALRSSGNLIVICTRQTPLSPWCAKEIETFRKFHGDQGIIAVLAEGEPDESFPPSLLDLKKELTLEDGTTEFVERELLAAELRLDAVLQPDFPGYAKLLAKDSARVQELGKQSTALLKTEIYRIVAAMLGVSFGDLKQRDKERRLRRTLQLVSAGAAVMLVFGIVMLNLYWRADAAELQSTQQSSLMTMSRAMEQVRAGDRMTGALVGKLAMDGAREEMPAYDKLAAQYAGVLNDALYTDAYETTSVLDTGSTSPFFSISNTDARVLTSGRSVMVPNTRPVPTSIRLMALSSPKVASCVPSGENCRSTREFKPPVTASCAEVSRSFSPVSRLTMPAFAYPVRLNAAVFPSGETRTALRKSADSSPWTSSGSPFQSQRSYDSEKSSFVRFKRTYSF